MTATALPQVVFFGLIPGALIGLLVGALMNSAGNSDVITDLIMENDLLVQEVKKLGGDVAALRLEANFPDFVPENFLGGLKAVDPDEGWHRESRS
jgi:hypothetical protein